MSVELVNTATGERTDLRFVDGLSIQADVSPEVRAEFAQLVRDRQRIREYIYGALGVPVDVLMGMLTNDARP